MTDYDDSPDGPSAHDQTDHAADAPAPQAPPGRTPEDARRFAIEAARMLADDRCDDVLVLDVQAISQVCDFLVIASGTSDRQMRSSVLHVRDLAGEMGSPVFRTSADDRTTWCVLDCVDVVVHVFEPNARAHYDLELLWGDATQVEWRRPTDEGARDRAGLGRRPNNETA